jgi:rod shape-determining protein MreC
MPLRDRSSSWRVPPIIVALVLCAALSALHHRGPNMSHGDPVSRTVRAGLVPGLTVTARIDRWWRIHVISLFHAPRLAVENAAVKAENLNLKAQIKDLQAMQAENDRLRALLEFEKKSPRPLLAAEVIALKSATQVDTLTINRGTSQGVHLSSVVVAPDGALVGQVIRVTPGTADVLLLTDPGGGTKDPGSSVGAQIPAPPGQAPSVGICRGEPGGRLRLTYLGIDAPVAPGAAVVTSGLGGIFPKDIPIGTVTSVSVDQQRSLKDALVKPAADFDHLDQAFVIR